jgi:1,2-diacylglycerol 3-alpha-glucosyltransferase
VKIAVASSGLGHVARGIETWALDTAAALVERGVHATLFARDGFAYKGPAALPVVGLQSLRRGDERAARLARRSPGWVWRWQLKDPYGWEQLSFWWRLWPQLRRGRFDILHVQDPMLAYWCRLFRRAGLLKTKEILAHGTEEPAAFLRRFEFVQHLAPWHLEQTAQAINVDRQGVRIGSRWTSIPNFVDTEVFHPRQADQGVARLREELGIPRNAFVVGTVAAVKKGHKRIDYLIREFAAFAKTCGHPFADPSPILMIAGARSQDSGELAGLAEDLAPGQVKFLFDRPRAEMPSVYRAMDLFVLVSLFEMMPIAVLEAMASGLPLLVNEHPVLAWMIGAGGERIDMATSGALSGRLAIMDRVWIVERGTAARARAEEAFSKAEVVDLYTRYYGSLVNEGAVA